MNNSGEPGRDDNSPGDPSQPANHEYLTEAEAAELLAEIKIAEEQFEATRAAVRAAEQQNEDIRAEQEQDRRRWQRLWLALSASDREPFRFDLARSVLFGVGVIVVAVLIMLVVAFGFHSDGTGSTTTTGTPTPAVCAPFCSPGQR